jgi:hypothetical protein
MQYQNDEEHAVARRLAKLRTMPVDTTGLEKRLTAQLPPRSEAVSRRVWRIGSFRALAASLILVSGIVLGVVVLNTSSRSADAQAVQMAQVHEDIVAGRVPVMQVDSIESANRMLSSETPDAPTLPQVPDSHVMACCMKSVGDKRLACVLLKDSNVPVTLAVARADEMKAPAAPMELHKGVSYRVQHVGSLSMVMTERDGKWLCLIGKLQAERLMDVASQVKF